MNLRQIFANAISGYRLANTLREQIEVLHSSVERLIVSNTIVVFFTTFVFAGSAAFPYARNWCLGVMISLLATTIMVRRMQSRSWSNEEAPAIAKNLVAMAGLRGIFWFVGLATLLPMANPAQTYLLGMVILGMMLGGIFAYWSLPSAALMFSSLIFSGAAVGLINSNLEWHNALLFAMSVFFIFFNRIALSHTASLRKQIAEVASQRLQCELLLVDVGTGSEANGLEQLPQPRRPAEQILQKDESAERWQCEPPGVDPGRQREASDHRHADHRLGDSPGAPLFVDFFESLRDRQRSGVGQAGESLLQGLLVPAGARRSEFDVGNHGVILSKFVLGPISNAPMGG